MSKVQKRTLALNWIKSLP